MSTDCDRCGSPYPHCTCQARTSDDSRPPREWWLVAKPDGTGVAVFLKERTAKLYMDANDIECAEHVIEKSAYDQLTQCLEELERELAKWKEKYQQETDAYARAMGFYKRSNERKSQLESELAEAKAALHTTRIIPGAEQLHKQLTEARAEIERLREEIMSTPSTHDLEDKLIVASGALSNANDAIKSQDALIERCERVLEWCSRRLSKYEYIEDNDSYPVIDAKKVLAEIAKFRGNEK